MQDYLHHPYGLYVLAEYDVSLPQVTFLLEEGFTLADFKYNTELFQQLAQKKKALHNKIVKAMPLIDETIFNDCDYKLAAADLSQNIIKLLKEHHILYSDIHDLTYNAFMTILKSTTSKEAVYTRIKVAFEKVEAALENYTIQVNERIYDALLKTLFDTLPPRKYISYEEVEQFLSHSLGEGIHLETSLIKEILQKNIEKDLIIGSDLMFAKKYIKIENYLREINFKDKDILIRKVNNETLQEIADADGYNVSRERIRQKLSKVLDNLPPFEEFLVYQTIFEEYEWPEELFNAIFNEHPYVYRVLKLKFKSGTKNLLDHLGNLSLSNEQKKAIIKHFNYYINYENQLMPYSNKMALFEHLVFNLGAVAVQPEEFIEIANEYIASEQLPEHLMFDKFSVVGLADRSERVIKTNRHGFRYYNLNNLETSEINRLKQLLNLEPGIYSMAKLYKENTELMNILNIDSEYELHNIYKKIIHVPNVEYTRMPEFSVGNITKEEFLVSLFNELAPIPVDDFVMYVEEEYGLKNTSLKSLIYGEYLQYLHGNTILVHHTQVTEQQLNHLKQLFTNDLYTFDEVLTIGERFDSDFRTKFLNNYTLLQIGYYIRGMFILSRKYSSIDEYFKTFILNQETFNIAKSPVYQTSSFAHALYQLERTLDAIRMERDFYITSKKLNAVGLSKEMLIAYRDAAYAFAQAQAYPYFTLFQIRQAGFCHDLEEYGFSDLFYERIIWSHPDIRSIHTASCIIFNTSEIEPNITSFIQYKMSNFVKIDFYRFIDKLQEDYGLTVKPYKLVDTINNSSMYYSAEMERIYLDKSTFFHEIY